MMRTIEVKARTNVSSIRNLRGELLSIAYDVVDDGKSFALVLADSKLSNDRLLAELESFRKLAPSVAKRIALFVQQPDGKIESIEDFPPIPADLVAKELEQKPAPKRSSGSQPSVLNILMLNWIDERGHQTVKAICEAAGVSYPTAAAVINQLQAQGVLDVRKDKSVALKYFPSDIWRKWVASGFEHRKTIRYADRSGQSRPPSSLIKRLQMLNREDVAISGIEGARIHYPDLDLSGALRLDLVLHGNHKMDLSFLERLDPALKAIDNPFAKADLAIHFLDRPETHFMREGEHIIADPLECLADLYDMRLDTQADEMLYFLSERKRRGLHA